MLGDGLPLPVFAEPDGHAPATPSPVPFFTPAGMAPVSFLSDEPLLPSDFHFQLHLACLQSPFLSYGVQFKPKVAANCQGRVITFPFGSRVSLFPRVLEFSRLVPPPPRL